MNTRYLIEIYASSHITGMSKQVLKSNALSKKHLLWLHQLSRASHLCRTIQI